MPRKTNEIEEIPVKDTKKATSKKTVASKSKTSGTTQKKEASKSTVEKKKNASTKSKTVASENTTKAKTSTVASKKTSTKAKTTKSTSKKTSASKATSKTKTKKTDLVSVIEYYDLPYRYNQTIVKILAQTPSMLFVYWDISDSDRKNFEEHFGDDFFSKTRPVLVIHNETMNYSFEIEINDFANSWYLHVNDANCKYAVELGRRPYAYVPTISEDYIYVSSSNEIDSPNNHILFEKFNPSVTYKNTQTGNTAKKDFSKLSNFKNMQKIYNIYDLYKEIYKNDLFNEIVSTDLINPSSSSFK